MSWEAPITDRTIDDVNYARANTHNIAINKGAINYVDLNRIEDNYAYVVELLKAEGYYTPYTSRNWEEQWYVDGVLTSTVRTSWRTLDRPWLEEINRIRRNCNSILETFLHNSIYDSIAYSNYMDYVEANTLEDVALQTKNLCGNMRQTYIYCGTIDCGGDILL